MDTLEFLAERCRREGEKTGSFFQELSQGQWKETLYTQGGRWTIHQVLAHFVSTEDALQELISDIAGGGRGVNPEFDIDRFNEAQVKSLEGVSTDKLMIRFQSSRQKTVSLVRSLSMDDLGKQGRHPFLGIVPLAEIIKLLYRHNQIHQRDIRKRLAEL